MFKKSYLNSFYLKQLSDTNPIKMIAHRYRHTERKIEIYKNLAGYRSIINIILLDRQNNYENAQMYKLLEYQNFLQHCSSFEIPT